MNSVPIPPPTDKAKRISEDHKQIMTLIEVVINSIESNNNQKLDLNDVINLFKSDSYLTSDDLEKYKPVIIEYVNLKNKEAEVIYTY
jgi:hypothetical protein